MTFTLKHTDRVLTIEEIASLVSPMAQDLGVDAVHLFGPYARGDATAESKVDLLVYCGTIDSYMGIGRLYMRLNEVLGKIPEIVSDDAEPEYVESIKGDSVLIYERDGARDRVR